MPKLGGARAKALRLMPLLAQSIPLRTSLRLPLRYVWRKGSPARRTRARSKQPAIPRAPLELRQGARDHIKTFCRVARRNCIFGFVACGRTYCFDLAQSCGLGGHSLDGCPTERNDNSIPIDPLQAMLLRNVATTFVVTLASMPGDLCREGLSLGMPRFSVPSALCACSVALIGIAVVVSTSYNGRPLHVLSAAALGSDPLGCSLLAAVIKTGLGSRARVVRAIFGTLPSRLEVGAAMNETTESCSHSDAWRPADPSSAPGFRRVGAMSALQAVLQEHGIDVCAMIAREGIPPGTLAGPENLISRERARDLLARCAEEASCPQLGISLARERACSRSVLLDRSWVAAIRLETLSARLRITCKSLIAARLSRSRGKKMRSC